METKVERILTVAVVIIVMALLVAMGAVIVMTRDGSMDSDVSMVTLGFLSMTVMTVVVIFGALVLNGNRKQEYAEYFERREREERERQNKG